VLKQSLAQSSIAGQRGSPAVSLTDLAQQKLAVEACSTRQPCARHKPDFAFCAVPCCAARAARCHWSGAHTPGGARSWGAHTRRMR